MPIHIAFPPIAISYYDQGRDLLKYAEKGAYQWSMPVIVDEGGSFSAIQFDSGNHPHIAYHVGPVLSTAPGMGLGSELRHAWRFGRQWLHETVDTYEDYQVLSNVGVECSLALDDDDMPHIGYRSYDYNHGQYNAVMVARKESRGMEWSRTFIDGETDGTNGDFNIGAGCYVLLDGSGNEIAVYTDDHAQRALKYDDLGASAQETIDHADIDGVMQGFLHWPTAAWSNNTIHVAYGDVMTFGGTANQNNLKHAWRTGADTWVHEIVDGPDMVGNFANMAVASDGRLGIVYADRTTTAIKCAYQSQIGGTWTIEEVEVCGDVTNAHCSIAYDSLHVPHVAYYNASTPGLMHAKRNPGGWATEVVDRGIDVGHYCSIRAV